MHFGRVNNTTRISYAACLATKRIAFAIVKLHVSSPGNKFKLLNKLTIYNEAEDIYEKKRFKLPFNNIL